MVGDKEMKKISILLICIIICTNLGGCMFKSKSKVERFSEEMTSEQEKSDEIMESIANALDNGDVKTLKGLYATSAIEATQNLSKLIEELSDYYQGTMIEYEGDSSSSTKYRSGKQILEFRGQYKLTTTEENYRVFFNHKPIDDINPEEIGLYKVEFVTEEEYQKEVEANGGYHWKYKEEGTGAYYSYSDVEE